MKRKIYNEMLDWKNQSQGKSALLLEGARRIGKSYSVEQFARNEYKSCIIIDFNHLDNEDRDIFDNYLNDTDRFLQLLQLHHGVKLRERQSVIVFDEVQLYPKARAAIKYLVADGRFDYIETGSLISIKKNVKEIMIPSEEFAVQMYPMDFEEFMWAIGEDGLMDYIREQFGNLKPLGPIHRKAMEYLRLYMLVGGMPKAVEAYAKTKDFKVVEREKQQILTLYRNDIKKYATGAETKAALVFEDIPGQLQRHERNFQLTDLNPNARYTNYESSFFWLYDSRIVNICYNSTAPNIGLHMNTDRTRLKCYMADTGLLISMAFDERGAVPTQLYEKILLGKLEANMGYLTENIVAQMLVASGHRLYFYSNTSKDADDRMEIDFLISKSSLTSRHNISPIEVKSGKNYAFASLTKFGQKFAEQLATPYILHDADLTTKNGVLCLPTYMAAVM